MTLSFKQYYQSGKPNNFVEKILNSIDQEDTNEDLSDYFQSYSEFIGEQIPYDSFIPKIHTIREDKPKRWGTDRKIHFVINNRRPNRYQFAPILQVLSIEEIKIEWDVSHKIDIQNYDSQITHFFYQKGNYNRNEDGDMMIWIGKRRLSNTQMVDLAINDGFDGLDSFLSFFNSDFEGKIIHWTTKRYNEHNFKKNKNKLFLKHNTTLITKKARPQLS